MTRAVSVYVDVSNIAMNGGYGMRYDVLRQFAVRGGYNLVHLNTYVGYDEQRANKDSSYRNSQMRFHAALRDFGYRVFVKTVKHFKDQDGVDYKKSNVDLDLAAHVLTQSSKVDRVILCTGDGDFVSVVDALHGLGCRVETIAFDNVSTDLKYSVDMYVSGYLIPGLLPCDNLDTLRGVCFSKNGSGGLIRAMTELPDDMSIYTVDTREDGSPYIIASYVDTDLPRDTDFKALPSRSQIFQFVRDGCIDGIYRAADIILVTKGA